MKRILKGVLVPVVIAILLGYISGKFVYRTYNDNLYDNLRSSKLYLVEKGEYESIANMRENNNGNEYVYYKDNDKYKTVVGITKNFDNVEKIKKLYNDDLSVLEYYVQNDVIDDRQDEYEKMLNEANSVDEVKEAVSNILNLYKSDNSVRLIAVN